MTGAAPDGPNVALPRSAAWEMRAAGDPGRAHRLLLSWPEAPPPPAGYPLLILLDGNSTFPMAVATARALSWRGVAEEMAPALILGLGHAGEGPFDTAGRRRDYTPPVPGAPPGTGEADAFLDFLEGPVLEEAARRFPVDRSRLALFGHSLGGLFALHALFNRPRLFRRLVAGSPSLWWGEGAPMEAARRFAAAPPPGAEAVSLLLTLGGQEGKPVGGPRDAIRAERARFGHPRDLAAMLRGTVASADFVEFPGETHGSVVPSAIARALRFALPHPAPQIPRTPEPPLPGQTA